MKLNQFRRVLETLEMINAMFGSLEGEESRGE